MSKSLRYTLHLGLAAVMLLSVGASVASTNNSVHASRVRTNRTKKFHKNALERAVTTMPKRNQKNAKYIRVMVSFNRKDYNHYPSNFAMFTFGQMRHGKFQPFKKYVDVGAGAPNWMTYKNAAKYANKLNKAMYSGKKSGRKSAKKAARRRATPKRQTKGNHMSYYQGLKTEPKTGKNAAAIDELAQVNQQWGRTFNPHDMAFIFGYEKNGSFHYYKHYFRMGSKDNPLWTSYAKTNAMIKLRALGPIKWTFKDKKATKKPVKNTPRKRRGLMLLARNKKTAKKAAPANHMTLEQGLITPVKSGKNASAINKLVNVNRQWVAKYGQGMEPFLFGYEKNGSFRYHPHYFGTGSAKAPVWKSYKNVDAAISDLDSWSN